MLTNVGLTIGCCGVVLPVLGPEEERVNLRGFSGLIIGVVVIVLVVVVVIIRGRVCGVVVLVNGRLFTINGLNVVGVFGVNAGA